VAVLNDRAAESLVVIDPSTGEGNRLDLPIVSLQGGVAVDAATVFAAVGFADRPGGLVAIHLPSATIESIKTGDSRPLPPEYVSRAEPVTFPTTRGEVSYGFYYPPTNPDFVAPAGSVPPLIVSAHGGPTGHSTPAFDLDLQYWTSRGFAVLDINYRGSTGFGREYRKRLYGTWGVIDIEDAVAGATYLVDQGLADADRLIVRGGSAGGFVTLAAHAFHDVFAAGANYYGVSDIEALARDTHKFESRYLDQLVGPRSAELYAERSPIKNLDGFTRPLITFQGLEDRIVPPNQSEMIVEALRANGIPVAYLAFEGEQHGFRRAENIVRAREAELYFYGRVLGFDPADELEPITIDNLE
jgi:dipeptidyl aminopeptidase/acylaminoacyl peptidase